METVRPMTPEELEFQVLTLAYGNLSASTNHKPVLSAFRAVVLERGQVSESVFDAWAAKLEWR